MSRMDSYRQEKPKEIEKGQDEKGEYTLYERRYEAPCRCHPETCCHFDEKEWRTEMYKIYKNGERVYV